MELLIRSGAGHAVRNSVESAAVRLAAQLTFYLSLGAGLFAKNVAAAYTATAQ